MKILTRTVLLLMLLTSGPVSSEIIPPNRICDWTPGVNVGVPGGIPNRTVIGSTVDAAVYGTGSADASAALSAAIDACPSGQVVMIPVGTYRLDSRVYRASAGNITIRGAGMGKTILKAASNTQVLLLGTADWPRPTAGLAITAGATKGSTVLTVADATSIAVGKLVRIQQNDLPYVICNSAPTNNNKLMSAMFRVTAKTATSVTVMPPLPIDFAQSPELVQYGIPPLTNTGVEDLTIDCNSISWAGIEFDQAWGCWVKDYLGHSIAWDAAISDHAIPNSYFRSSKPLWFGNLPWPPFDPANPPGALNDANLCRIPAGYRYVHGTDPVEAAKKPGTEAERRINSIEGTQ